MSDTAPTREEVLAELVKAGAVDVFGREVRTFTVPDIEVRYDEGDEEAVLEGHAAVFNQETVIGSWFREEIAPGAFKKTLKDGADVRHLFNHDPSTVLARTKSGTLDLSEDKVGLAFTARLNMEDPDAVRVVAKVGRGDVSQSSFAFLPVKVEWEESTVDEDGLRTLPKRIIKEARLFDTSTVTYPAYEAAETMLRAAGLDVLGEALGLDPEAMTEVLRGLTGITDEATPAEGFVPNLRAAAAAASELADEYDKNKEAGPTPTSIEGDLSTVVAGLAEAVRSLSATQVVVATTTSANANDPAVEETLDERNTSDPAFDAEAERYAMRVALLKRKAPISSKEETHE